MTQSTQPLPTLGLPNATEDSKVRSLLSEIQGIVNGGIDASNLAAAAITSAKFAPTIGLTTALVNSSFTNAYVDVNTTTFTPAVAGRSLFIACAMVQVAEVTTTTGYADMKLVVDGVDQSYVVSTFETNSGTNVPVIPYTLVGVWVPTLTAGAHTVKTQMQTRSSGSAVSAGVTNAWLLRLELGS